MKTGLRRLTRAWIWLRRVRHRCGYGIHSPFAFGLVTGVVYERAAYYAYTPLRRQRRLTPSALPERDDRLMLRLINHHRAATCLLVGRQTEMTRRYLEAGRAGCRIRTLADPSPRALADELRRGGGAEMYCLVECDDWPGLVAELLPYANDRTLIAVSATRRGIGRRWREVEREERVRVAFDLHDWGLAYFDRRLNKQNYVINYI